MAVHTAKHLRAVPRRSVKSRAQWEEEQARIKAEEEAQAAESARLEEFRAKLGHPIEAEILFSEAFLKWLELYKSPPARKPSTYASYLDTYRIHFAEAFGNLPLYQITQTPYRTTIKESRKTAVVWMDAKAGYPQRPFRTSICC